MSQDIRAVTYYFDVLIINKNHTAAIFEEATVPNVFKVCAAEYCEGRQTSMYKNRYDQSPRPSNAPA